MTRDDKTEEVRNGRDNMRHEPRNDGETNVGPYGSYLPAFVSLPQLTLLPATLRYGLFAPFTYASRVVW